MPRPPPCPDLETHSWPGGILSSFLLLHPVTDGERHFLLHGTETAGKPMSGAFGSRFRAQTALRTHKGHQAPYPPIPREPGSPGGHGSFFLRLDFSVPLCTPPFPLIQCIFTPGKGKLGVRRTLPLRFWGFLKRGFPLLWQWADQRLPVPQAGRALGAVQPHVTQDSPSGCQELSHQP